MRIIFMGTPSFAVPALAALIAAGHDIVAVYSQPPRPSGRGYRVQLSPVHSFAQDHGFDIRTPLSFKNPEDREAFEALNADVAIVVAYGLILPSSILAATTLGCLNLHGSLLPRWRGAAPIQRAIMARDTETGIQVMQMEKGLDTGPVLLSERVDIRPDDTAGTLSERLSHIGADLLPRTLAALSRGGLVPQTQPKDGVTYAHKISTADARIDWSLPASHVDSHIRGLNPMPGAWTQTEIEGKQTRIKIWLSTIPRVQTDQSPGTITNIHEDGIDIACGDGHVVRIKKLQRPSKSAQESVTFLRGCPLKPGQFCR